ncbi:MAG: Hsp70 family protein [Alphaproteobacteria bacterium]|nr:Hsp70 family protein [Alphaproteobacteria bacterium]
MGKAIGIDLGTTNTVVAVLRDGRPQVLEDAKGYRVLPSVVTLNDDDSLTVGHAARNRVLTAPDRTVYAIKRLMGRRYDSEQVTEARGRAGYDILPAGDGTCLVRMGADIVTPVDVSAEILRQAKVLAERAIGEPVDEAVITVPAYFNHQQRAATMEAAQLAGLRCDRLVNEPTAAALAYGLRRDVERTLVVFDLGGGTFDVSVLHLSRGVYEILATLGDTYLGGEDFDYRLVDYLADHFQAETGFDLRQDRTALQRIKDAAERAKCELSFTDRTTVLVPRLTAEHNLELAITRLTLESLVEDLVERALEVTRRAISDAGLQLADIDDVILVGGQTRMPRVREAISGLFGKEPSRGVHPEEVVAIGAAVHAASFGGGADAPQHVLIDVTPFDLGIDVAGGLFQAVVPRNSHVPASETRSFATTRDDQDSVKITVRQGESRFADDNEFLGEFLMDGLTPAPRMEVKVDVTFRIDGNGMLHVGAVEQGTGESRRITVRNYAQVARGQGQVAADIEGDVSSLTATSRSADATVVPVPGQRKAAAKAKKSGGLLSSLFGRKSAPADKPAAKPASQPAAAAASAAGAAVATGAAAAAGAAAAGAAAAAKTGPAISLPSVETPEELEDTGVFDVLEPEDHELLEPLDDEPPEPSAEHASIGMAGAAHPAWDDGGGADAFAMPSFEEDEDEDEIPVGLAGGPIDDAFALPDESYGDGEDDAFEMPEDAFPALDESAFDPSSVEGQAFAMPSEEESGLHDALRDGGDAFEEYEFPDDLRDTVAPGARASTPVEADEDDLDEGELAALAAEAFAGLEDELTMDEPDGALEALGADDGQVSSFGDLEATDDELEESGFVGIDVDFDATQTDLLEGTEADTGELFGMVADPSDPEDGLDAIARSMGIDPDRKIPDNKTLAPMPEDVATLEDLELASRRSAEDIETLEDGELYGLPSPDDARPDDWSSTSTTLPSDEDDADDDLFRVPDDLRAREGGQHDDEKTEIFARSPGRSSRTDRAGRRRRRKPARLKLAYRQVDAMVSEYRENLRRGGCFVKTNKPLPVGRECVIEVRAPGLDEPLSLAGVVTWSSVGLSALPSGQDPGMGIEYRIDEGRRVEIENLLSSLGA